MAVREEVEHRISHCDNNSPDFDRIFSYHDDTPAYTCLVDLSDKENIEKLKRIAGLTPEHEKELEQLKKEVRAKEANHPSKRQIAQRQKRLRFARLHNQINNYQRKLQQPDYDDLHKVKLA